MRKENGKITEGQFETYEYWYHDQVNGLFSDYRYHTLGDYEAKTAQKFSGVVDLIESLQEFRNSAALVRDIIWSILVLLISAVVGCKVLDISMPLVIFSVDEVSLNAFKTFFPPKLNPDLDGSRLLFGLKSS